MATPFIYCFIRKDLPKVQQIIQMSHACYQAGAVAQSPNSPHICLFEVSNEIELLRASKYLRENEIDYEIFFEPDFGGEYTAICTEIIESEEKRALFAHFRLYRD